MWLFSEFFNELHFLSWVNHFMSNHCYLKTDFYIEQLILVASGLFKLIEFYGLELLLLPTPCGIIVCHGLAVQL